MADAVEDDVVDDVEDDVVDIRPELEETCKPKCVKAFVQYQQCVERIASDTTGDAHCTGQYFDYWACIDECTAPKLFQKLK
eukprot:CAMPEP_0198234604 /NCGR_PEP_ID=MMETSP1446-20131203/589_1 /TAXON_ID=1461542 ORGANISM="Unidentified sp, Strain CCMP2111" /NCGR_SAMPLE_ID=MMETSP1446 /ASSEMBLY_ACC=CAM_ASM_001112 /LENGTH=80 /DNA_ID=CAMNT_0043915409 /DNA_START=9 /DNA_END=251 /DNA_ORIENTATION=-